MKHVFNELVEPQDASSLPSLKDVAQEVCEFALDSAETLHDSAHDIEFANKLVETYGFTPYSEMTDDATAGLPDVEESVTKLIGMVIDRLRSSSTLDVMVMQPLRTYSETNSAPSRSDGPSNKPTGF